MSSHCATITTGEYAGWRVTAYYGDDGGRVALSATPPQRDGAAEPPQPLGYSVTATVLATGDIIGEGWEIIDAAGRGGVDALEHALAWLVQRHRAGTPLCPTTGHGALVEQIPGTDEQRWCGTWYACPHPACRRTHLIPSAALRDALAEQGAAADDSRKRS
jgi:hypothetical protein